MTNPLDGEWSEPATDRDLEVRLQMKESLVRDCSEEALARLLGEDAARTAKKLLIEDEAKKTTERKIADQLDAYRHYKERLGHE